jgi:hypothetical protein
MSDFCQYANSVIVRFRPHLSCGPVPEASRGRRGQRRHCPRIADIRSIAGNRPGGTGLISRYRRVDMKLQVNGANLIFGRNSYKCRLPGQLEFSALDHDHACSTGPFVAHCGRGPRRFPDRSRLFSFARLSSDSGAVVRLLRETSSRTRFVRFHPKDSGSADKALSAR